MQGSRPVSVVAIVAMMVVGALAALPAPGQAAKFYKWVDEQGVTHYTEKAPEGTNATTVRVGDTTSSDAEDEIKQLGERRAATEAEKKKAAENAPKTPAAGAADERKRQQENCDQHRKNMAVLQAGGRISTTDEKGERRYLSPEEIQAQTKTSEDEIKRCEEAKIPASAPPAAK